MNKVSYLGNAEPSAIEDLYTQYQKNPASVDLQWQKFFEGFEFGQNQAPKQTSEQASLPQKQISKNGQLENQIEKEAAVLELINEYRSRGHLFAKTNPIRKRRSYNPPITLERFQLQESDLNTPFQAAKSVGFKEAVSLQKIIEQMEQTYCSKIGCEFNYVRNPSILKWLTDRMESTGNHPNFNKKTKIRILDTLLKAVHFEQFLHSRFVGQKRFSLEGLEALIPAIQTVIDFGATQGIKEFVMGMAHRGRLNLLGNIFQKDYENIFSEFEGKGYKDNQFGGDVKYHMGHSTDCVLEGGQKVHLNIIPNPSHLEAVNPVVAGVTRAKLDQRHKGDQKKIAPILIHGDASIAGQGVIYEQIQMSQLESYAVGGTIHIITNNQIGFTTNYTEARSSTYCSDIAKTILSPVFHVNADDIEMVVYSVLLALEFRQIFQKDVFIDILGYRKYGHNEGDDPSLTQPILYKLIAQHPNALQIYAEELKKAGHLTEEELGAKETEFRALLDQKLEKARLKDSTPMESFLEGDWKGIRLAKSEEIFTPPKTGVEKNTLKEITEAITILPSGYEYSKKIHTLMRDRNRLILEKNTMDWAMGEALAFGTLLKEGFPIRFSGEDCLRGTFSHRHAMLRSEDEKLDYYPLKNIAPNQARFEIYNSILSEYAVLGFEYGYALSSPQALTLWEAQYGDFANGAQIIIDQFLSCAETKWQRLNGLVLLLPHGFEGQGSEHSSARVERYLQLSAEENMFVTMPSTPANFFHLLRRQVKASFRKPLVVFTPKSMLRNPLCRSNLDEIDVGTNFQAVLEDKEVEKKNIKKIILCAGKVYYDLWEERKKRNLNTVALLRLEQFYPFPKELLEEILASYPKEAQLLWVQEEPENQGALSFLFRIWKNPSRKWSFVSRRASATTATGFIQKHKVELANLLEEAFL